MSSFRFQDLDIWKESILVSNALFKVAHNLRNEKFYSFSDQLLRATLSITNNIAEGSGSSSNKDFANYLNIVRRSTFECANIVIILYECHLIEFEEKERLVRLLKELSKRIYYFRKTLISE